MGTRVHDPRDGIYAATPDYVYGLELRGPTRLLFTSGTMGLDPDGAAGRTLEEQLELVWSNIRTILASADMTTANIVRVTSYLRDAAFAEENQNARLGRSKPVSCRRPRSSLRSCRRIG